jgi:fatty acid desaturase
MVPPLAVFGVVSDNQFIKSDGRLASNMRSELRHIPNLRNAISVFSIYAQAVAVVWAAVWLHHPVTYLIAFILMGRSHAQCLALMHESVHRLLFRNRSINDFVGRWLLGYPSFTNTDGYRHVHMAHHREEFGPNEPDIPLYANYPITKASFLRKMKRDALGTTGYKMLRGQFLGMFSKVDIQRSTQRRIFLVQFVLLVIATVFVHPLAYVFFWLLPYLTVWRVMNRLRSIAEHGGLRADNDRRVTTHSVRQHVIARLLFVPFNLGWHIAHHADAGIPFRSLPKYHRMLRESGYVTDGYEFRSYTAIWRALASQSSPNN